MSSRDPRVDVYIAKSVEFLQPILIYLRKVIHATCPDVEETIKWGFPHFMYRGMLCSMAAFKQHCAFGFWKAKLIQADYPAAGEAMGEFGRILKLSDLPSKQMLASFIEQAMKFNEEGVKVPRQRKPGAAPRQPLEMPSAFAAALKKHRKAAMAFEAFSQSHRREYVEWIAEAKRDETRERRIATALEWLVERKPRHWKYQN